MQRVGNISVNPSIIVFNFTGVRTVSRIEENVKLTVAYLLKYTNLYAVYPFNFNS